ncbi:MAG: LuxR C-terminal-related transcriptional regulator [Pseudomonadaceae bacterium]|jgi:LuxR family maltose regulon positive regulatory protein|nr:LuxR C-terminal-related transcriptional regulator [Pseudomonadaceae bacterium]
MTLPSVIEKLAPPILRTKLYPADSSGPAVLERTLLVERLLTAREQRLLLLSAPAGFGKSTILSLYRQRLLNAGATVAWLSCDESDSEPQRLLQCICAAISEVLPSFHFSINAIGPGDVSWPIEALVDAFVVDLKHLPGNVYLIIDDFHLVRHPQMGHGVRYLLEKMPARLHLIISSRYNPQFLSAEQQVMCLQAEDLRLSADETAWYFNHLKQLDLGSAELKLIHQRTEGWVAALHLTALALSRHPDRSAFIAALNGTERNIADYLAEDVLSNLPEELQLFLDQTSLLDEFCADLCEALTGRSDSGTMLARLQSEQLFLISLDDQQQWFRYHHLFAEYLQGRLAARGDFSALQHAAARWCEDHDFPERAIKYALRARDYAFAAELLERQGAGLIASNQVYGVLGMINKVPAEVMREHPVFQIFYAWQLAFEQKYAEAEALIEEVSTRLMQGRGKVMHFGLAELLVTAQLLKSLVLLYQDKLEPCLKVCQQWLSMVPSNQAIFRASLSCIQAAAHVLLNNFAQAQKSIAIARESLQYADSEYLQVMVSMIDALTCKARGDLIVAHRIAATARERVEQVFGLRSRVGGPLVLAFADILYEQDQHALIVAELPQAMSWRDVATPVELISRGQLVLIRGQFYSGASEQAMLDLDAWLAQLQRPGYERVLAFAMSCKVHFLLWLQRPNEAERICLQLQRHQAESPSGRYPDEQFALALAQARLALSERRADKAQLFLEGSLAKLADEHQRDRRLRILLLLSVAYWRKGNDEKAFAMLRSTLEEAWACGYRRLFADDALWLLPLWDAWFAADAKQAGAWLEVAKGMRKQCVVLAVNIEKFDEKHDVSHREQEILRFVAAGLSNRDIAQAVHLSEATIKWHLHNLFAKLGVRSRTQAVLKGKAMGLLNEA